MGWPSGKKGDIVSITNLKGLGSIHGGYLPRN